MDIHKIANKDDAKAYFAELSELCRIQGDEIVFGRGDGYYAISLATCASAEAILFWVLYLSQKSWVTPDILDRFAGLAADHYGISIHN